MVSGSFAVFTYRRTVWFDHSKYHLQLQFYHPAATVCNISVCYIIKTASTRRQILNFFFVILRTERVTRFRGTRSKSLISQAGRVLTAMQFLIVYRRNFHRAHDVNHNFCCKTESFVEGFPFQNTCQLVLIVAEFFILLFLYVRQH